MKVGVVVVTHGQLATELVNSAEMIVGDLPHFTAVSIGGMTTPGAEEIGRALRGTLTQPPTRTRPSTGCRRRAGELAVTFVSRRSRSPANLMLIAGADRQAFLRAPPRSSLARFFSSPRWPS
jgi:hypothetical protein